MVSNYSWGLDSISHSAHYSKNWDKNKQNEYNKWYYENKTKKKTTESRIPDTPYTINDVEKFNSENKEQLDRIPKHEKSSSWSTIPEADHNAMKSVLSKLIDLYGDLKLYEQYIEHHGVQDQKWGVQNGPPYPLDSSLSTGKRLKPAALNGNKKTTTKQISAETAQKRKAAIEKARQTRKTNKEKQLAAEAHAKEVKEILASGDRKRILSIAPEISYDQLTSALNKADVMDKLISSTTTPKQTTWDKLDDAKNKLDKTIGYYTSLAKVYNIGAQIYNSTKTNEKDKWLYLPTNVSPTK